MASTSLGLGCGGGEKLLYNCRWRFDQACNCPSMVAMTSYQRKPNFKGRIMAVSMSQQSPTNIMLRQNLIERNQGYDDRGDHDHHHHQQSHEKLDKWMRDSVVEIVKNLREAPLLVHVYDGDDRNEEEDNTTSLKVEKKVEEEIWPAVVAQRPEGVIFVERLEESPTAAERAGNGSMPGEEEVVGVVVQGRGGRVGPACYLLKTNRVGPACYLLKTNRVGPACHFCLVRVKSFRETTARQQFEDCWLVKNLNNQSW